MSIPAFTPGYPPDGASLGQTKAVIRNNLDGTFQTVAVDHIDNNGSPGSNPSGYHKNIHLVPQSGDPAAVAGYGQLYTKTITSINNDEALFYETGDGRIAQMTMNIDPLAATTGYSFLPGGIFFQWGQQAGSSSSTVPVVFSQAFPNNCFNVIAIPIRAASSPGDNFATVIVTGSVSTTGFSIGNVGGHTMAGWYWIAIGN